jgi:hypothetical protein
MLLGILLTIFLLVIFPLVAKKAGLSNAQDFTAQNIFNQSVQIVERLFSFGKEAVTTYQQG